MNKRLLKVLSVVLSLIMLIGVMPAVFAAQPAGNGSAEAPYEISDLETLKALNGMDCTGKYFILTSDIVIACEDFVAIGNADKPFDGIFDGNGHKLIGADDDNVIFDFDKDNLGIFGCTEGAVIKNVIIDNISVEGCGNIGTLAGFAEATDISGVKVIGDCSIYGDGDNVGGIVGLMVSGSISDCVNTGEVLTEGKNIGGIAGCSSAVITRCVNYGVVGNSESNSDLYVNIGGIVGKATADVTSCINTGDVFGYDAVAGTVGNAEANVAYCGNSGNVATYRNGAGVVCTLANGTAEYCFSAGTVTKQDPYEAFKAAAINASAPAGAVKNCVGVGDDALNGIDGNKTVSVASALSSKATFDGWDFDGTWSLDPGYVHSGYDYPMLNNFNLHSFAVVSDEEATCTSPRLIKSVCDCGLAKFDTVGEALPHTWVEGEVISAATCIDPAKVKFVCSSCNEEEERETDINPTAHVDNDDDNKCDLCNKRIKAPEKKKTVWDKIVEFFARIKKWFNDLFAKIFKK